ncbi:MAG: mechanosensitive ion channel [Chitinophagaceae bacterium]
MFKFFDQVVFDNPIKSYLLVLSVILFIILLKRMISRYIAALLSHGARRIWKSMDIKSFKDLMMQPLGMFLVIFISIVAFHKLKFPAVLDVEIYDYTTKDIVHFLATTILIISFVRLLLRLIDFIAVVLGKKADRTTDPSDNQLIVFFKDFFKVLIVINGMLMVLHFAVGFDVKNLLTGLSIVGAALALSLRESLENLIASFIIFFDKPFVTGDQIKVQNITGVVEKIGLRSTRLRTDQKTYVSVPNKQMVDTIVDNLSLRSQRRADLKLEIGLSASAQQMDDLVKGVRKIVSRREIENSSIFMNDIASNAFIVSAEYYTAPVTIGEFNSIRQDVNMQVLKLIEELKLEIAGATTDVRVTKP